jgi:predicted flap endonuclease-1-like 5' DNA nuclease
MGNTPYVIESALLLIIFFLVGCYLGYLLHRLFGGQSAAPASRTEDPAALATASADAEEPAASPLASAAPAAVSSKPAATVAPPAPKPTVKARAPAKSRPSAAKPRPTAAKPRPSAAKPGPATAKPGPTAAKPRPATAKPGPTAAKSEPPAPSSAQPAEQDKPATLAAPRNGGKDDLKQIKGIGPKIETTLNGMGIYHFDQVAGWTSREIAWVDDYLSFRGRINREKWVGQAKAFVTGK